MNTVSLDQKNNFLYYGLLGYMILFYTQLVGRLSIPFRLEFFLGAILLIISLNNIFSGKTTLNENKLNYAVISFFVFLLLSIPFALVKSRALDSSVRIFKFFSIYIMIVCALTSEKNLKGFFYVYISMAILLFFEPFLLSLQGKGFIYNNHMLRLAGVTGYFAHPNMLGITTSSNLPFLYYSMTYSNSKLWKIVFFLLLIIALRVIMLTQSRTGMVGAIAFFAFVWMKSRHKLVSALVLIICMVILWSVAPQDTKDRFLTMGKSVSVISGGRESLMEREDAHAVGSILSRWEQIVRSLIVFKENPIIGVGMDNYKSYSGRRWGVWFPPHNTYAQALAETGLIGTIALGMIIFFTFQNFKRSRVILRQLEEKNRLLNIVLDSATGYYFVFLVVATFGIEFYSNAWWIAGGLSVVLLRICRQLGDNLIYTNSISSQKSEIARQ